MVGADRRRPLARRVDVPWYLDRLRATGRGDWADRFAERGWPGPDGSRYASGDGPPYSRPEPSPDPRHRTGDPRVPSGSLDLRGLRPLARTDRPPGDRPPARPGQDQAPGTRDRLSRRVPQDIFDAFRDADLLGLCLPTELGGSGAGILGLTIAIEEVAKYSNTAALMLLLTRLPTGPILIAGNDEQKQRSSRHRHR